MEREKGEKGGGERNGREGGVGEVSLHCTWIELKGEKNGGRDI